MWAEAIVKAGAAWLLLGAAFAPFFVTRGVQRIDPLAHGATIGFRLAIVPGVLIFWPLLAARWLRGHREPPLERNAHRRRALAVVNGSARPSAEPAGSPSGVRS